MPSHKCTAKQQLCCSVIKRNIDDPVALPSELDPRILNAIVEKERSWYAQSKDAFLIYEFSSFINQFQYSYQNAIDHVSVFPRSKEYEYQNIEKRRLKNVPKDKFLNGFQCSGAKTRNENKISRSDEEPFSWKEDESNKRSKSPVESTYCYGYNRSEYNEQGMNNDHVNYNIQTLEKDCAGKKSDVKKEMRWQALYELMQFPTTDTKRKEEFRMLTKPYLHDLNTWYAKNVPTKLHLPIRWKGKRPIPEWRFSHM
ncbi:PREDICTED: uncharacterized protein LOC107070358 [Polistes dominula]|uniref:Uncharacterized protein LOC107070358 n=1 Tax=Polistes dominula TaxID=743375 RepID=A0ABM1IUS0_POLDO|nr:PREDICTED: uncharacterized protein LOC107070358 [Polistes dominula]